MPALCSAHHLQYLQDDISFAGAAEAEEDAHQAQLLNARNWKAVHHRVQALIALCRNDAAVALADEALCNSDMPQEEMKSIQRLQSQAKAAARSEEAAEDLVSGGSDLPSHERLGSPLSEQPARKSSAKGANSFFKKRSEACLLGNSKQDRPELMLARMQLESGHKDDQSIDRKAVLKTTGEEGQHLVAKADISLHETIFFEEASFAVVTWSHRGQVVVAHSCSPNASPC